MSQYPENTLLAMRRVAPYVDGVELDVQQCRTGELVVFHDETLDRVTDATGRVAETPWSRLSDLEVLDSGEGIPRLEDALEVLPSDLLVNVELKTGGVVDDVYRVTSEYDHDVLVSSFDTDVILEAMAVGFETTALLLHADGAADADTALELDCAFVHPSLDLCFETDVVARAHERGLEVNAWTANTAQEFERLVDLDVDGVIANRHDLIDRWAGGRAERVD